MICCCSVSANAQEANTITRVLARFSVVSGQKVGPEKSAIWFSRITPLNERIAVSQVLRVSLEGTEKKYLGAPIQTTRESYEFLIEKVQKKFQLWKRNFLSHAGRLIMVKSVLQSLPVYYMATSKIPVGVVAKLTSLIRQFFWGKTDKKRFMAYVGWGKITKPVGHGGLGIRDLSSMNNALLMKSLWKMAAGSNSLWVKLVRAKYIPKSELWQCKRDYNCTSFWRSLVKLRESLLPLVSWKIGNGSNISAFAQPWFQGAVQIRVHDRAQGNMMIRELLDEDTNLWDVNKLVECYGYEKSIIESVQPPVRSNAQDRLIFLPSANGNYYVKRAYNSIKPVADPVDNVQKKVWESIWKRGEVLPRVRIFLWKLMHEGLPLGKVMNRRFPRVDPICSICGRMVEYVVHLIFLCDFARLCWFAGPLGVRSGISNGNFQEALLCFVEGIDNDQWLLFVNTIWAIWRCRNDLVYAGRKPNFEQFKKYFDADQEESLLHATSRFIRGPTLGPAATLEQTSELTCAFKCFTDGSWVQDWFGGIGFVLQGEEELVAYKSEGVKVCCALQAEAVALKRLSIILGQGIKECTFFTDNMSLVNICSRLQPPTDCDWRVFDEMMEIWRRFKAQPLFKCVKAQRSQVVMADYLAKLGRIQGWSYVGHTYPIFNT